MLPTMKPVFILLVFSLPGLTSLSSANAVPETPEDIEAWLEFRDEPLHEVNEGELAFLASPPDRRILKTRNWLILDADSLKSGWVRLHQCQGNLDPVPDVEIVYRYHGIRNLQVLFAEGMDSAIVQDSSVQMKNVQPDAEVCIAAEAQVLKPAGAGRYRLTSGPFHRRFLDGYYPIQLDYRLRYPPDLLTLEAVVPATQTGFQVSRQPGELKIDALFEGKLTIEVSFSAP